MPMAGKTLLEQFAVKCDLFASMEELSAAVAALVAPFGYPNVASGVLGNPGTVEAMHFANWEPAWMDLYRRNKFLRIDPAHLGGELRRAGRHCPIVRTTAEGPSACSRRADGSALRAGISSRSGLPTTSSGRSLLSAARTRAAPRNASLCARLPAWCSIAPRR